MTSHICTHLKSGERLCVMIGKPSKKMKPQEIIQIVQETLNIEPGMITTSSREGEIVRGRIMTVFMLTLIFPQYSQDKIGKVTGLSQPAISHSLKRFDQTYENKKDPFSIAFRKDWDMVVTAVSRRAEG